MDVDNETRLIIIGDPVSKGRPRFTRYGKAYTPKRTADAEKTIAEAAKEQGVPLRECPVSVDFKFFTQTRRRSDLTNLCKVPEDALNKIAWTDDYLIEELTAHVYRAFVGETPRTEIVIRSL